MTNLGLVLVTYVYLPFRMPWVKRSFDSLLRTELDNKPYMQLTYRVGVMDCEGYYERMKSMFDVSINTDQELDAHGIDSAFVRSANKLFNEHQDVTHVFLITDDFVYNPQWYKELAKLIDRHSDAKAWTVYKSAHTRHHKVISKEAGTEDTLVTSISGTGAVSRKEWFEYNPIALPGFTVPPQNGMGETIDLHHAYARPGNRWATNVDYMSHIGTSGINCHPGVPEHALNFIGE